MSNEFSYDAVVSRLSSQSDAVGRLAQDSGGFAAVVAAFESKDADAFRWVLDRLEMFPYCELICEWVRVKMCVLRCFEICGPPPENVEIPSLEKFANAAVKLAANEKLLRRVVDAVSCGDRDAYSAAIQEGELTEFCHLICHWVCSTIYRRVCEVVCRPTPGPVADAASEIRASGKVIAKLVANKKAFKTIGEAAVALNCETLQNSIRDTDFGPDCEVICCFICLWRCVSACREVCGIRRPEPAGVYGIEEARTFALAARELATQPRALGDLVSTVAKRDAKAYSEIVSRFGLGPYCYQLCAWICAGICYEFCICVCPPTGTRPWFTHVGDFDISPNFDISTTTGLTIAPENGHGGPKFAFYSCLNLIGFCPAVDPAHPSEQMAYRFLHQAVGAATPTPIAPAGPFGVSGPAGPGAVCQVFVGTRTTQWKANPNALQSVWIRGTGLTSPTPPTPTAAANPPDHFIVPDANGWVTVDKNALGGIFDGNLMGFDSPFAFPGGPPTPGVPAGTAVPPGNQKNGTTAAIIFQATRVSTIPAVNGGAAPDYTNQLDAIRINNWSEVAELNFAEFGSGCCTPIDKTLHVEFTVDHEELNAGTWSLTITSCCSSSAPGDITPPYPPTLLPPGDTVIFTAGDRGASGTILEDTSNWGNCSYVVQLDTTPKLTTGLLDRSTATTQVTFAICSHQPCSS